MQVVILAAGRGRRFQDAGYKQLKPLIPVCGVPMIQHALRAAQSVSGFPTILCPWEIVDELATLPEGDGHTDIVSIHTTQSGAACTLLAAASTLDETLPVLVMDCDSIIAPALVKDFADWAEQEFKEDGAESALLCFRSTDDSELWSFVDINPIDRLSLEVREKVRVSDIATCGVHAFKSWTVLRAALARLIAGQVTYNLEYYLAPVHNTLRAAVKLIPESEFHPIGTPAQLEAYEQAISAS